METFAKDKKLSHLHGRTMIQTRNADQINGCKYLEIKIAANMYSLASNRIDNSSRIYIVAKSNRNFSEPASNCICPQLSVQFKDLLNHLIYRIISNVSDLSLSAIGTQFLAKLQTPGTVVGSTIIYALYLSSRALTLILKFSSI